MVTEGSPDPAGARRILGLAVPAFGALVAEPLFLLVDAAIVGRLGTSPLAGLGIAGTVLATAVNLFVFLAYGTTASVARRLGAGDRRAALAQGVDGLWLAGGLGVATAVAAWPAAPWLVGLFGAGPDVAAQAVTYLRWSLPGLPGMLVVLAATGALRGLLDTRTPLVVAGAGAVVNAGLNVWLVHGVRLGIAGSAIGTAITQLAMAVALAVVVVRGARRDGAPLRPDRAGIVNAGRAGVPLLVRTLTLRAALVVTAYAATAQGPAALAAHQVAISVWGLLALALDALAIAAQALTGAALGAGDLPGVRAATARMVRWGVAGGAALAVALLAVHRLLPALFSTDPGVRSALSAALVVVAVSQPLAGYVFVLDGVLIGAGDGRYLAVAGVLQLACYAPVALLLAAWAAGGAAAGTAGGSGGAAGLVWLWVTFAGGYMLTRAVFLGLRARTSAWLVTGPTR
jgi:putative MATE family efflux protein